MDDPRGHWFPAKRRGWGWGLPCAWQGWLVLVAYVVLLAAGAWFFGAPRRSPGFLLWTGGLSVLLGACCWLKGEPPRWRWGE